MTLTSKIEMILLEVPKINGSYDFVENACHFEESCNGKELDAIKGFWGWLVKNKLEYGHGNLHQRWNQWQEGKP